MVVIFVVILVIPPRFRFVEVKSFRGIYDIFTQNNFSAKVRILSVRAHHWNELKTLSKIVLQISEFMMSVAHAAIDDGRTPVH